MGLVPSSVIICASDSTFQSTIVRITNFFNNNNKIQNYLNSLARALLSANKLTIGPVSSCVVSLFIIDKSAKASRKRALSCSHSDRQHSKQCTHSGQFRHRRDDPSRKQKFQNTDSCILGFQFLSEFAAKLLLFCNKFTIDIVFINFNKFTSSRLHFSVTRLLG